MAADPHDGAFDTAAVQQLLDRAEREVSQGRLPSCQVALARHGEIVTSTFGSAGPASRYVVFSISKALVAGAMWVLISDGVISPDTRVAELIEEFASPGKDDVTVEHLLTHTAGFPRAPMRPEEGASSEGRTRRFATWRLDWAPGTRTAYHATSAHWVLAELIERASGVDFRHFVAERVTAPLGLHSFRLGVPIGEQDDVLDVSIVGNAPSAEEVGTDLATVLAEAAPRHLLRYNEPVVRATGVPGAGAVASAADVVRYFAAMLRPDNGVWDPAVLADATGRVRNRLLDPMTDSPANRTLGLVVAGDDGKAELREVGRNTGPRAFVASGIGGQVAWADPDTGLAFCFLTNGIDVNVVTSFIRTSKLSSLAALATGR